MLFLYTSIKTNIIHLLKCGPIYVILLIISTLIEIL